MDLSIIIVSWNTRDLLRQCLRSIHVYSEGLALEIIVADNASSDGSADMVEREFPKVQLLRTGGNLGFARANNAALRLATAPLVLFLNPDTELRGGFLRTMLTCMDTRPDVAAVGCKIRDADGTIQELGLQWFPSPLTEFVSLAFLTGGVQRRLGRVLPRHCSHRSGYVRKLFGACLMVRRDVMKGLGGFDERFFMYCEDVDLCRRIERAGWRLYYLSEAEILHHGAGASGASPSLFSVLMMCQSLERLMRKYYGRFGALAYRAGALAGGAVRLALLPAAALCGRRSGGKYGAAISAAARKYSAVVQWSLGMRNPTVRG